MGCWTGFEDGKGPRIGRGRKCLWGKMELVCGEGSEEKGISWSMDGTRGLEVEDREMDGARGMERRWATGGKGQMET
jgi:hypothetical protein